MNKNRSTVVFLVVSLAAWVIVMGLVYYTHFMSGADEEIGYYSSDVTFDAETRNYYNAGHDGVKIGYKSEIAVPYQQLMIFREDAALKLGIAGKPREVFTQTSVTVDTLLDRMVSFAFILHSGTHIYACEGAVRNDSLVIQVKKSIFDPIRSGVFIVDPDVTIPLALPYFMSRMTAASTQMQVFDPISFTLDDIVVARQGSETVTIGDSTYSTIRYDIANDGASSSVWLDGNGMLVRNTGSMFFSGEAGEAEVERAFDKSVFLLPLETNIGDAMLDSLMLIPDRTIENPRRVSQLDVVLGDIRAANIDIDATNKELLSANPVTFLVRQDASGGDQGNRLDPAAVRADTTVLASTDYIEPRDIRIRRTAESIAAGMTDTRSIANTINSWVHDNMTAEEGLDIVRSVDILKDRRGASDEYTKLYVALARSLDIPAYVNMGLVYDGGGFRYHSWPSVFANGEWRHLDPFYGQDRADATHITLIRGGFEQKIELFRLMRHITIHIREYGQS